MSSEDEFEREQVNILVGLLRRPLSERELEGFRILYPRFIDRYGGSRLGDLQRIFCTDLPAGQEALSASLHKVADDLGSYDEFAAAYPVTIVPPLPAYPLFPVLHLPSFQPTVYRVMNRRNRTTLTQIASTGKLPLIPHPAAPVLRQTPRGHWCAYEAWASPDETRRALQILPAWSDCAARAIINTRNLEGSAYVAYSVDPNDAYTRGLTFHGYFYETVTQDHDDAPYEYHRDAVQICVFGEPEIDCLEEWDEVNQRWEKTWTRA